MKFYSEDPIVQGLKNYAKNQGFACTNDSKGYIVESTEKVNPDDPDIDQWLKELDEDEKQTQERVAKGIHESYEKARPLVKQHPNKAPAIVKAAKLFSQLFLDIAQQVGEIIKTIVSNAIEILKKIWEFIETRFNGIINTVSGWFSSKTLI